MKLLSDRVLIEVDNVELKTGSGLIVPKKNEPGDIQIGVVMYVGEGRMNDEGKILPIAPKVGDKVMFQFGNKVMLQGKQLTLVNEIDIIIIL